MQCRDVREMADSFLSEELLTETNHEILRHLETCPVCREDMAARRTLRASVRSAFDRSDDLKPSPEFVAQLHNTLRKAALEAPSRRTPIVGGWWAVAATVLLAVGLASVFWARSRMTTAAVLTRSAVGDHRYCAVNFQLSEKPIPLEEAAQRYDAVYRVLESLPPDEVATQDGFAYVRDRHSCVYDGRRFAHVVLDYRGAVVSLLVTASDGGSAMTIPEASQALVNEGPIDSMSVVSVRAPGHMIFFVGDLAQADLTLMADVVGVPLARQLARAQGADLRRAVFQAVSNMGAATITTIVVAPLGKPSQVDQMLAERGQPRRIRRVVPSFGSALQLVTVTDYVRAGSTTRQATGTQASDLPHNPDIALHATHRCNHMP